MSILNLKKREVVDYSLMFLLISISGNPFFSGKIIAACVFFYAFFLFIKRKNKFNKEFSVLFLFLVIVTILQSFKFNFFPITTLSGVYIRVLTAYFVVKVVGFRFISYYINILYFIAVTSLIFYLISNISINILIPFSVNTSNIESVYPRFSVFGVFTYIKDFTIRNSGPFWEPGAFSGYLILAFIFNFFSHLKNKKKIRLLLLISIITTMSTTGYIAVFVFYLFSIQKKIKSTLLKFFVFAILLFAGFFAFSQINFLGNKIDKQISNTKQIQDLETSGSGRFLSYLKDVKDFEGHEFIGRGFHSETRFLYKIENQIRTVGLTDIIVKMGLPFILFMFFMFYESLRSFLFFHNYNEQIFVFTLFLTFLILLTSEVYFNYSLFWAFLFLKFIYPSKKSLLKYNLNQTNKLK